MKITRKQLRRLIRESLLNESADLKKLKKMFYADLYNDAQVWELADSLGLGQQFETMLSSDSKFLKIMFGYNMYSPQSADESPISNDVANLIGFKSQESGAPNSYNPTTRTGKLLKKMIEDNALELMKNKKVEKFSRENLYRYWLSDEEKNQLDWKEVATGLGVDAPLRSGVYSDFSVEKTDPGGSDKSKYPGTHVALSRMVTMGAEGVPDFFDWIRTLSERNRGEWVKVVALEYGENLPASAKAELFDLMAGSDAFGGISPSVFKNI